MTERERQERKEQFIQSLWRGKESAEGLKARCRSAEETALVDEAVQKVEQMDHDFLEGFRSEMGR